MRTDAGSVQAEVRECRRCGETKPLADFQVYDTTRGRRRHRCRPCENERVLNHRSAQREADPEGYAGRQMAITRKHRYGVTPEDYARMLSDQDGGCAICGSTSPRNGKKVHLAVDHDHATGQVRGLLCDPCNNGLARFGDDPGRLLRAASYLRGVMTYQD